MNGHGPQKTQEAQIVSEQRAAGRSKEKSTGSCREEPVLEGVW
jgi:hypothetical protein